MKKAVMIIALVLGCVPTAQSQIAHQRRDRAMSIVNVTPNQATTGTSEQELYSLTIPGGTLASVGDAVEIEVAVQLVNNANAKTLRLRDTSIGGASLMIAACANNNANACVGRYRLVRVSTTGAVLTGVTSIGNGTVGGAYGKVQTPTFSAPIVISITGETAGLAGDMTLLLVQATKLAVIP